MLTMWTRYPALCDGPVEIMGGWDSGLQTRSPTTRCMALGLEWQNGHVSQGLSAQARVHQGNLGVLYNGGGVLGRKRQSSKYVQRYT